MFEDSDTGVPNLIIVRMEYILEFVFWYGLLCAENLYRRDTNHYSVKFCSVWVLRLLVGEGWWCGAESVILGRLKSHLFESWSAREVFSYKPSCETVWLLATRATFIHPVEKFILLLPVLPKTMRMLGESKVLYFFFLVLIKRMQR